MPSSRTARSVVRSMLAWFALHLGAAVASLAADVRRLRRHLLGRRPRPVGADRRRRRARRGSCFACTARSACPRARRRRASARSRGDAAAAARLHPAVRAPAAWPAAFDRRAASGARPARLGLIRAAAARRRPRVARPPPASSGSQERSSRPRPPGPPQARSASWKVPSCRGAGHGPFSCAPPDAADAPPQVARRRHRHRRRSRPRCRRRSRPRWKASRASRSSAAINATDSEDALKYLPSLLVRKRYIGDYNHAMLSSRASGTGNSARSAVYADGILLSNYLGNGVGGLNFPPRWGMVTPEEIERVDVMYGPFSAAYPGNSVGAVVDYVTRMPTRLEAHAKVGYAASRSSFTTPTTTYRALADQRLARQPARRLVLVVQPQPHRQRGPAADLRHPAASAAARRAAPARRSPARCRSATTPTQPLVLLGTGTAVPTRVQDHSKVKLAYDITPTLRASYILGLLAEHVEGRPAHLPAQCAGQPVYSGAVNIDGRTLHARPAATSPLTDESLTHLMHGLSVKSHTQGAWDWELRRQPLRLRRDDKRQNAAANAAARRRDGGAGTAGRRQRHRLEHPGRQGHLAAAGIGRRAHRRLRRAAGRLQAALSHLDHRRQLASDDAGALVSDVGGDAPAAQPVRAGRLALRAALEGRARPARRALAGREAPPRSRRTQRAGLSRRAARASSRPRPRCPGRAARHGAQGLARPRGAHADRGRALRRDVDHQRAVHQRSEPAPGDAPGPAS